ncbi:MAG: hypothetical protein NTX22_18190 [Ignavibacteriales bacterium]|nr:hypothetical protein [Ignavibacteriales bacterium]
MAKSKKISKPQKFISSSPFTIYWDKGNYYFLLIGIVLLIIGFYLMSVGTWDSPIALIVSPITLIISYFLIIPTSIFYRKRQDNKKSVN